jgi:hypothetical protein
MEAKMDGTVGLASGAQLCNGILNTRLASDIPQQTFIWLIHIIIEFQKCRSLWLILLKIKVEQNIWWTKLVIKIKKIQS